MNNKKLDDIICKNENPFSVPEGYFERLCGNIMNQIPERQPVVPTPYITAWQRIKPWFYMAAMFCIIMISARYILAPLPKRQITSQSPVERPIIATAESYTDEYIEETIMNMQADDFTVYCYLTGPDEN